MLTSNLKFPLFIGLRYTRSKRREGFMSFVSGFSFGAMALGVMALIVVLSVMNGFDREIKTRLLNIVPHITIENAPAEMEGQLAQIAGVMASMPFAEGQGMLGFDDRIHAVSVQGVEPDSSALTGLRSHMVAGELERLQPGEFGVVIGSFLARALNVVTGDSLLLTLPEVSVTPVGIFPRVKRLHVVGVFEVGAQLDNGVAFIHRADANSLYRAGSVVKGLRLYLQNPFAMDSQLEQVARVVAQQSTGDATVDTVAITTWQQAMSTLFRAIRMEKTVVGVLLAVIIAVAAFNIVASLVLMVSDKRKDIAVLRTLGARGGTITGIFTVQGTAIGLLGVLVGVVSGCLLALTIGDIVNGLERLLGFQVFDPSIYFISRLPSVLQWQDVTLIAGGSALVSLLATLYPAWRAGQVQPAEALRYDH